MVSLAPLRPAGYVNFCGAGQGLLIAGRGSLFFRGAGGGGASIPDKYPSKVTIFFGKTDFFVWTTFVEVIPHIKETSILEISTRYIQNQGSSYEHFFGWLPLIMWSSFNRIHTLSRLPG